MLSLASYIAYYGVNSNRRLIRPVIVDKSNFLFPEKSILIHFRQGENEYHLTDKDYNFKGVGKVYTHPVPEYISPAILGNPIKSGKSISTIITGLRDVLEPNSKIQYLQLVGKQNLATTDILAYDLSVFPLYYKSYTPHIHNMYYKWKNGVDTLVNLTIPDTLRNRQIFISLELPDIIPTFANLEKYSKYPIVNNDLLKVFNDYKLLNLLELWKLFSPKVVKSKDDPEKRVVVVNSIFRDLLPKMDNTHIIFSINGKYTVINLRVLISIFPEYGVSNDYHISKMSSAETGRRLFRIFIEHIIRNKGLNEDEVKENVDREKAAGAISLSDNILNISNTEQEVNSNVNSDSKNITDANKTDIPAMSNTPQNTVNDDQEPKAVDINVDELFQEVDDTDMGNEDDITGKEFNDFVNDMVRSFDTEMIVEGLEEIPNKTIDDINKPLDAENDLRIKIDVLLNSGMITKKQAEKFKTMLDNKTTAKSPYDENVPLLDVLDISKDNYEIGDTTITPTPAVIKDSYNKNIIGPMDETYITQHYEKDIVRMVYSVFENSGMIIDDFTITKSDSILGGVETHSVTVQPITGGRSFTLKPLLPTFNPDGTFKMSGNTYVLTKQRADLPIRKISSSEVSLSSYYGNKLFIERARLKANDIGYWFKQQINKKNYNDPRLTSLVSLSCDNEGIKLPKDYEIISRYIQSFKWNGTSFQFKYGSRYEIINEKDNAKIKNFEKTDNSVVIGSDTKNYFFMRYSDSTIVRYSRDTNDITLLNRIFDILEIKIEQSPIESTSIRIYSADFPTGLLLAYYLGLENLLGLLKTEYATIDKDSRYRVTSDEYSLNFKDMRLIVKRDYGINDLIIGGLLSFNRLWGQVSINYLNSESSFNIVMDILEIPTLYKNEIKMLETLFIDPITLTNLQKMKEPESFVGLLVRANQMLLDDSYENPTDIQGMTIKGHERVAGMYYTAYVNAIRDQRNKSYYTNNAVIDVPPFSIMQAINSDSTTMLVDDLNPIASIKQKHAVTFLGMHGRSKDGMGKTTRILLPSEIGIISEGTKDSGQVGITASMTAAPAITDIRGHVRAFNPDVDDFNSIVSISGLISPAGESDDLKRANFSGIQNSHVTPMIKMRAPYIRTGLEPVVGVMADDKFVVSARQDGEVIDVTKNAIKVVYADGTKAEYKLYSWTSKEESGSCFTHKVVTIMKKGDKFRKDDSLTYDSSFFEPDIFDPKRAMYRAGTYIYVALSEDDATAEDSAAISSRLREDLGTIVTKTRSLPIPATDEIVINKYVGDKVLPDDPLFSIIHGTDLAGTNLSADEINILKSISNASPKSKYDGVISKVEVRYNCPFEYLSESLKQLVSKTDKDLEARTGFTGQVNSSYSISGIPLPVGDVEIKYYIDTHDHAGIGDKYIFANQLKCTIGEVFDYDIRTEKTKEQLDGFFGLISIMNRVVGSPQIIGTTSTLLRKMTLIMVAEYNGSNRNKIESFLYKYLDKIDSSKTNSKLYKDLFAKMSDDDFRVYIKRLEDDIITLCIIMPNHGPVKVSVENNFEIAKELGVVFHQRLIISGDSEVGDYMTPIEYLCMWLPIRKAYQTLDKKMSVSATNQITDELTGQSAGSDKRSSYTGPQINITLGTGGDDTITELIGVRGGDKGQFNAYVKKLYQDGEVSLKEIKQFSTKVESTNTLRKYFLSMHIGSTL